jgi:hypothetical protein
MSRDIIRKEDKQAEELQSRQREDGSSRERMRKERTPLYVQQAVTYNNQDPNYHYRLVNDSPNRIQRFIDAGWELCMGDNRETYSGKGRQDSSNTGSLVKRTVNEDPNAPWKDAYLMRIPVELFEADQQAKHERTEEDLLDIDRTGELARALMLGSRANLVPRKAKT